MTAADTELLFPDDRKAVPQDDAEPHFAQLIEEMKHYRFLTLQQGWVKYLGMSSERKKYSYSQYCELFNRFAAVTDVVARLQHEPGKAMFVDWAGPTLPVVDPNSEPTRRKMPVPPTRWDRTKSSEQQYLQTLSGTSGTCPV